MVLITPGVNDPLIVVIVLLFAEADFIKGNVGRQSGEWSAPHVAGDINWSIVPVKESKLFDGDGACFVALPKWAVNDRIFV